jgi:predicted Ser/Thr protein kinase
MPPDDSDLAADLLEAALFGSEELIDQATVDLSVELPLIEGYKLLRLLGEGGFGMVYEAEQRVPIRRRVALKVLRPGCTTRELLARFEQERQMLALLNHPHIARIFDAGETEDGRPFIAMELVKGSTIDRHAQKLPLQEKVSLMRDVSRAVGYAHRKGVIHRDLKPSNILITKPDDGAPEPRVIDFGIAKALDGPLVTKVMFTQIRQIVGTPGYMSPERQHTSQISHSADTRSDVFALGAILWELLSGKTPEQTPEGSTTRVSLPAAKTMPAELRWITEKATDPDMERRYGNADALADDLDAWLSGHPLTAAPRSTLYTLKKWARRHRTIAAAICIASITLVASLIVVTQALFTARQEHDGMQRALSRADYFMGVSRERRRPVLAIAHWARALRHDPQNTVVSGMLQSSLMHRDYPHPVSPATPIPVGEVRQLALSSDARWAALIQPAADEKGEILTRIDRETNTSTTHAIPADGRMTLLAVAKSGHIALAAAKGPVGLLQPDGSWKASTSELESLRGIAWNAAGELWMIGVVQIGRCDASGAEMEPPRNHDGRLWRWSVSADAQKLALGIEGGRIHLLDTASLMPQVIQAPIPAPFAALSLDATGTRLAAAWRNGEVWLDHSDGTTSTYMGDAALNLHFLPESPHLLIQAPQSLATWNFKTGGPAKTMPLTAAVKNLLPLQNGHALLQPTFGDPVIQKLDQTMELPGVEGRVLFASAENGRLLALADMENHVIEWLAIHDGSRSTESMPHTREWLGVTRSRTAGVWMAVDRDGWVCELTAQNEPLTRWRAHEAPIRLASLNAAGDRVLFDTVASPEVMLIDRNGEVQLKNWGKPSCLALSPNGKTAALGFPAGHIAIFDLESSREIAKRDWQRGPVTAVTFVDDQRIALAAAGQLRVWHWSSDTATPAPIDFPGTLKALAPDASGQRLAAASSDSLHLIDIATGLRIASQFALPEDVTTLLWDERLHAFSSQSETKVLQTPPLKSELTPDQVESLIGMQVDAEDRVVRLRSREERPAAAARTGF